jgi:hypothetical protein
MEQLICDLYKDILCKFGPFQCDQICSIYIEFYHNKHPCLWQVLCKYGVQYLNAIFYN